MYRERCEKLDVETVTKKVLCRCFISAVISGLGRLDLDCETGDRLFLTI